MLGLVRSHIKVLGLRSLSQSLVCSLRCARSLDAAPDRCFASIFHIQAQRQCRSMMTAKQSPTVSRHTLEKHLGSLSSEDTVLHEKPLVIVVSGPSGVGKDAVLETLRELRPELSFVVTATSRDKRPGEVHGKDYLFVSKEQFEQWLQEDKMLEHAMVYGEYKGIPKLQVDSALAQGSDVVLRIDVQGAQTLRRLIPDSVHIFLVAESEAALVERLASRKTEPLEKLLVRAQTARSELQHIQNFDYVIVNREGKLEETVRQIASVISVEKLRVIRSTIPALQSLGQAL